MPTKSSPLIADKTDTSETRHAQQSATLATRRSERQRTEIKGALADSPHSTHCGRVTPLIGRMDAIRIVRTR